MRIISRALELILVVSISIVAVAQKPAANLHGRVVDARTGEPIAKVRVIVSGTDLIR